jgi:class 3 adenylate cyclase
MEQKDYRLAAIMYTDIAGFSRMMEKDEAGTLRLLKQHNDIMFEVIGSHHGTVVKTIGDALLVDFKNTVEALQSAMEIQDRLYLFNKEHAELPLLVRIGVHLGDIYFYENDALGEGINIAARLQSLARPGCVCFSQDVYNLVLNKIEFRAEKLGKVSLKNITKEIHAYEIASANVEFDPDRDKPRPGFKPGSLAGDSGDDGAPGAAQAAPAAGPATPTAAPVTPAASAPAGATASHNAPERDYSEEGSRNILSEIRRAILEDIKMMGRRMTVDEARSRYGYFGVEAEEVIASMTEKGILARSARVARAPTPPEPPQAFAGIFKSEGTGSSSSSFDAKALGKTIEAAVDGLVGEIEKSIQRGMDKGQIHIDGERNEERYRRHARRRDMMGGMMADMTRGMRRGSMSGMRQDIKETVKRQAMDMETGKWDKKVLEDEAWKPGAEELSTDFVNYRKGLEDRCRKQRGGFIGNFTSFLAVNGLLWFLNLTTNPGGFLWAAIVSAAWGIGVVSSAVAAYRATTKLREIDALPDLDSEQLGDYKKLNRVKDSLALHGASALTVPFLLGLINFLTGPSFLWFLIPSAAIVLSFLSHVVSYGITKPRLEKKLLASMGIKGGWSRIFRAGKARKEESEGLGPYAELYREADRAKRAVEELLKEGAAGPADAELIPSLNEYLGQVRLLAQSANEIDRLVETMPMADLAGDKAALVQREASSSESLKTEYRRSITEIEKQEKAYQELKDQSEVIRLRLGSSVNQLKQMRLDIARVKAAPGTDGSLGTGLDQLKRRTDEMSRYLEDLRKGYDEGRKDPFAELEDLARAEEERRRIAEEARRKLEGPGASVPGGTEGPAGGSGGGAPLP